MAVYWKDTLPKELAVYEAKYKADASFSNL